MVTQEPPGLGSLYYAGPFKAMRSVWVSSDMAEIPVGETAYPVWFLSLFYYAALSLLCGGLAVLRKVRKAHA